MSERTYDLDRWVQDVITGPAGFQSYEAHELPLFRRERDVEIAAWVIRCLANVHNDGARFVLDCIEVQRTAEGEGLR